MMLLRITRLAFASLMAVSIVACTGASPSVQPASSAGSPAASLAPSAPPSVAPSVARTILDEIRESGVLKVGMSATYEPYEYFAGTEIVGFDPDLIAIFAADLGVKPEMIDTDWTGVIASFYAKQFDVVISGMTVSKDRASRVLFTQPYEEHLPYLVFKTDPAITVNTDLLGKQLAAVSTDADTAILASWASSGHAFKDPIFLASQQEAFLALIAGRADVAMGGYTTVREFAQANPGYSFLPGWGPVSYTAIAVRQGDEPLCNFLNDSITRIKTSGKLAQVYQTWFGWPMPPSPTEALSYKVCSTAQ
jgi:ABC-type amino acid transport substrate-binding protein